MKTFLKISFKYSVLFFLHSINRSVISLFSFALRANLNLKEGFLPFDILGASNNDNFLLPPRVSIADKTFDFPDSFIPTNPTQLWLISISLSKRLLKASKYTLVNFIIFYFKILNVH